MFGNMPVGAQDHQVLRNPGVSDPKCVLQRFHVMLAISQILNDAYSVWM